MIVAAVDRQPAEAAVVREGRVLADAFGSELHVLHVHPSKISAMDVIKDLAAERAESVAKRETEDFEAVGRIGDIAAEILQYARERDAQYIVVGGRKRSPVGKVIFGSTSLSIIRNADRPVVTVSKEEWPED